MLTDYLRRAHEIQRTFLDVSTSCEALQQVHQRNCDRIDNATDEVAFLAWMTKESTDWKLALKDFRPGAQVAYGDHDGRSLHMSGAGSYESICRMLNDLRTCPRMNRIASLSIVPFNAERTQFDVNLQVELLTSTSK